MLFGHRRIYADAAAATPVSLRAQKELIRLLQLFGNPGALHREAVAAKKEIGNARERIAQVLGAHADEIVFTGSGTEANNLAIVGFLRPLLRDHGELGAVTTPIEHQSVLEPLNALEEEGLFVTPLAIDATGTVSLQAFEESITDQTAFISVQLINSEVGTIQPIRDLMKIVRRIRTARDEHGLPLIVHCDASQAPLWMTLKVDALGIDLMTLDAQKMCGPKGIGMLYVRRGTVLEPVIHGGGQEKGLRGGTENAPLIGAFKVALEDAQGDVESRAKRVGAVRDFLFSQIQQVLPATVLHGADLSQHRAPNNLNISVPGLEGEKGTIAMDAQGVAISTRSACSTDEDTLSHVLLALGVPPERAKEALRITLLPDATVRDAKHIVRALLHVATRYGSEVE